MTTSHTFHRPVSVTAHPTGVGFLRFKDRDDNDVCVFMPLVAAQMMAAAWEQYRDFVEPRVDDAEDEPEPLDAETVAQRQSCTEINIIVAGRWELL